MIHDVDESLRALVKQEALAGNGVEVAFDAPTKEWVARRNAPAVDLYLYDIREDLSRRETLPPELLSGTLEGTALPVILTVALPPSEDRSIADVWSAMGGELKPSLDLVVTAPMEVERALAAGPPVLEEPILTVIRSAPPEKGRTRRRTRGTAAAVDTGLEPAAAGVLAETRRAGTRRQPGRTLRIRGTRDPEG